MKKALTGIQATGNLTLGNYIGAIKQLLKLQEEFEVYAFVANLHSIVLPIEPKELKENTDNVIRTYLAAGLDPKKVKLWRQSDLSHHAELNWLLTTQTTMGELSRMTQFKDKSQGLKLKNGTETIPTGLLTYPVLQAADILLFNPEVVPVGEDQKQHLELTRTIGERMNNKFRTEFVIPKAMISESGFKIMALQEPTKKMSKSDPKLKNTIFLMDPESTIRKKIRSAMTDDENKVYIDKENKPGVYNLLSVYAALADVTIEEAEEIHKDMGYGDFKNSVADKVVAVLVQMQEKFASIGNVDEFLSTEELRKEADITIFKTKEKMGF